MRQRSTTWKNLAADGEFSIETVAVINGTEYSTITAPIVNHGLLPSSELSVGNCISASLNFTVMTTDSIPKSAKVVIKSRLTDGSTYSEWLEFGTFWISHRDVDDDLITLECYDAMLMANQEYGGSEDAMNWPKPMSTVVNAIATRLGVSVDSRTIIKTGSDYVVAYPGDMTMLEVLGYIGACHGGNWIITHENKLRLVPVVAPPTSAQASSVVNVPVVIGELSTGQEYTVSRVTMAIDDETVYTAGDDSGFELKMDYNPYATQGIVNDLLTALGGIRYVPFNIESACYDPAAELGDQIIVGSVYSVLFNENRTYDLDFRADAEAPGGDELEDEYPYQSDIRRLQQSTIELGKIIGNVYDNLSSQISQTQTDILLRVSREYATISSVEEIANETISGDQLHYLATSASSGVTTETAGWSTTIQSVTATNKYLWTYHTYTFGDGHSEDSSPVITGVYGDKGDTGKGISSITEYYAINNSTTAPADSAFSTTVKSPTVDNRYLWNYELITYSDGTSTPQSKHITAVYGQTGTPGTSITGVVNYYLASASASGVTRTGTSGWTTSPQTVTSTKKYLWNYEQVNYSSGNPSYTEACIIGVYGDTGGTGVGISEVTPLYYAKSTDTAPSAPTSAVTRQTTTANQWTKAIPTLTSTYKYLFTCDQVLYTNGTYAWTTVVLNNAISGLSERMTTAESKITDSAIINTVTQTVNGQTALVSVMEQNASSIRMKADTITWEADNSSMDEDGTLTCTNAEIQGTLYNSRVNDGRWVKIDWGIIEGGITGNLASGSIDFNGTFGDGDGPVLYGDTINLFTDALYTTYQNTIYTGYTGTIKFITDITAKSGGGINWTWTNYTFINGLLVE